ncbi:hypothetical protein K430107D3_03510 [Dysosmobacter welbionis]
MIASTATRVSTEDSSFFQKVNPSAALAEGDFDMRRPPGTAGRFPVLRPGLARAGQSDRNQIVRSAGQSFFPGTGK